MAKWSLAHPLAILGAAAAAVLLTVPINRMVGRTFIPDDDMGQITAHVDTPQGTSLEGTAAVARSVVKDFASLEGVAQMQYVAGAQKVNHFHVFVYLKPLSERTVSQQDVVTRMRQILADPPGQCACRDRATALGGGEGNFAIQAGLLGPDVGKLYDYLQKLLEQAQQTPSMVDAEDDLQQCESRGACRGRSRACGGPGRPHVDRGWPAAADGVGRRRDFDLSRRTRTVPVKIRVLEDQRRDVSAIGKLTIPSATAGPIRVDNIARFERGYGPTQIRRVNRQYSIDLQADVAPGHALDEASNDVRRLIAGLQMRPGYSGRLAGQTQILDETTANLMMGMGLASVFVYMVLAAQFESFVQPIIIMLVLPVSVPFAMFTLWATGRTLNLWSALGILLLFGIVKRN